MIKKYVFWVLLINCAAIFFAQHISAQKLKKLKWNTELCSFAGTYDSSKFTENQLRNTLKLFNSIGTIPLSADITVFKYENIKSLKITKLDLEYQQKKAEYENLEIVKVNYWENIRQQKIRELDEYYKLAKIKIESFGNPLVLRNAENDGECRQLFAEPLIEGGESLLMAWKRVNEIIKKRNGNPERIQRIFDVQYSSPDKLNFALVEVTGFGWWNCVNEKRFHLSYDEQMQANFNKLFKRVKQIECDEP